MKGKQDSTIIGRNWEKLISDNQLLSHLTNEKFTIQASVINSYKECRLMTKFDHTSVLPQIFKINQLHILPISRIEFVVGKFNAYTSLQKCKDKPEYKEIPNNFVTLPCIPSDITTEQTAIACANVSGIIADFVEGEFSQDLVSTISGRMGSGKIEFFIDGTGEIRKHKINVDKAQMEVDAVFESPEAIYVIEAKNHECDDFITRQLYYPYRYLMNKNPKKKPVIPIFMKYVNGVYYLYKFHFEDERHINSIVCDKCKSYTVCSSDIKTDDIDKLLNNPPLQKEKDIIFPQANTFSRVEDIVSALYTRGDSLGIDEIRDINLDIDPRQARYYMDAVEYLGLAKTVKEGSHSSKKIILTKKGRSIAAKSYKEQKLGYAKSILENPIFHSAARKFFENGCYLSKQEIAAIIGDHRKDLNSTTSYRRASTVSSWLQWISNLVCN